MEKTKETRCIWLGQFISKNGAEKSCNWLRQCEIHKETTLRRCRSCKDYETEI